MKQLEERILKDATVCGSDILKVDTFITNQVDPQLMKSIGDDLAAHFSGRGITKIAAIESSGIAPALMTALAMDLPMVILKKHQSRILNDRLLQTEVTSFTTGSTYEMTLPADTISEEDHVLIIDDFLADGEAVTGAARLIRRAHATVAGVGILIEKSFQPGREKLTAQGFEVYSLARITSLENNTITFS